MFLLFPLDLLPHHLSCVSLSQVQSQFVHLCLSSGSKSMPLWWQSASEMSTEVKSAAKCCFRPSLGTLPLVILAQGLSPEIPFPRPPLPKHPLDPFLQPALLCLQRKLLCLGSVKCDFPSENFRSIWPTLLMAYCEWIPK